MKKILICEDEPDQQTMIASLLSKRGYEVFTAVDGKESIGQTKKLKPDLIILDIRMPKIDGLEVAKEIRKFDDKIRIIFITAFESLQLQREAVKYEISDYIVKPTSGKDILKAVQDALK